MGKSITFNVESENAMVETFPDPTPTLAEVQNSKLEELNTAYSDALIAGFTTDATGSSVQIKYGQLDQLNFLKRTNAVALGTSDPSFSFGTANGVITFTTDQWKTAAKDAENFEMSLYQNLTAKRNDVSNATTIDAVNAIVW